MKLGVVRLFILSLLASLSSCFLHGDLPSDIRKREEAARLKQLEAAKGEGTTAGEEEAETQPALNPINKSEFLVPDMTDLPTDEQKRPKHDQKKPKPRTDDIVVPTNPAPATGSNE